MKSKHSKKVSNSTKILIAVLVIVCLALLDLATPLGGNIAFYAAKWVQCGQRPLEGGSNEVHTWYKEAPLFAIPRTQSHYLYCTPQQAAQAGYTSPYPY